jgi:hypothetical protein
MKSLSTVFTVVSSLSLLSASSALADENAGNVSRSSIPAVTHALEIGVGAGYAQGTGDIGSGMSSLGDLSSAGGTAELQVGYRIIPQLELGLYGTFSGFASGDALADSTDVLGATAGVQAAWHFLPAETIDPWIGLSTGWRGLWLTPSEGKNTSLQGFELARLQVGVDYRVTPEVAIAPVVGASLSMFVSQDAPGQSGYEDISDPQANVFFFAGLMGRFDLLGQQVR